MPAAGVEPGDQVMIVETAPAGAALDGTGGAGQPSGVTEPESEGSGAPTGVLFPAADVFDVESPPLDASSGTLQLVSVEVSTEAAAVTTAANADQVSLVLLPESSAPGRTSTGAAHDSGCIRFGQGCARGDHARLSGRSCLAPRSGRDGGRMRRQRWRLGGALSVGVRIGWPSLVAAAPSSSGNRAHRIASSADPRGLDVLVGASQLPSVQVDPQSWLRPCYGQTNLRGHPRDVLVDLGRLSQRDGSAVAWLDLADSVVLCVGGDGASWWYKCAIGSSPTLRGGDTVSVGGRWRPGLHEGRDGALHHCSRARRDPVRSPLGSSRRR